MTYAMALLFMPKNNLLLKVLVMMIQTVLMFYAKTFFEWTSLTIILIH